MLTPKKNSPMVQENEQPSNGGEIPVIYEYARDGSPNRPSVSNSLSPDQFYTAPDYTNAPSFIQSDDRSWFQKSWDDILKWGGSALAGLTGQGWLIPLLQLGGDLLDSYLDRQYAEEALDKQLAEQRKAEDRANAEYDRREASARAYNDAWADRLRSQGFNPLAALSKGSGVTATHSSAPSTSPTPAMPNFRGANAFGIGSSQAIEALLQLAQIKQIEAQTSNIEAQTEGQQNENESYWERFSAEMSSIAASVRNTNAQARINESAANVAEATEQWNIESAQFHCEQLALDLRRGGVEVEIAQVALLQARDNLLRSALERQLIGQQIVLNGQEISLNELTFDQFLLGLNEMKATSDARTRSAIATFEAEAKKATVEANWAGINQFTSNFSSLANSISNVVSAVKPGISVSTSTTE